MKCKQKHRIFIIEASKYESIELGFKYIEPNQRMERGDLHYGRGTRKGIHKKSIRYKSQIRHRISEYHKLFYESIFYKGIVKSKVGDIS